MVGVPLFFHLKNDYKHSQYDCHGQFLQSDHHYKRNTSKNTRKETSKHPSNISDTCGIKYITFFLITKSRAELNKINRRGTYVFVKREDSWELIMIKLFHAIKSFL